MNKVAQDGEGSVAIPRSGHAAEHERDGVARIGVAAVFHLDVLKVTLPEGDASDGAAGANPKKQVSLDLDDLW